MCCWRLGEVAVKRITIIEFGVNDGGGSGRPTSCCGIDVRTDTVEADRRGSDLKPKNRGAEGPTTAGYCSVAVPRSAQVASTPPVA